MISFFILRKVLRYALLAGGIVVTSSAACRATDLYIGPPGPLDVWMKNADEWRNTRQCVSGIIAADHILAKVPDDKLRVMFRSLKDLHLKLQLEVGVIKEWSQRADHTFLIEAPKWDHLLQLGAPLASIAMDEPLSKGVLHFKSDMGSIADDTARFIQKVRLRYPGVSIGDIEPYPSISGDQHVEWLAKLNQRLTELRLSKLDFYRIDPDWNVFDVKARGSWKEVASIAGAARRRGILFSLIYWGANIPMMQAKGLADQTSWYTEVMHQGYAAAAGGVTPGEYVIESWISSPPVALPENQDFTFANTVREFCGKFLR